MEDDSIDSKCLYVFQDKILGTGATVAHIRVNYCLRILFLIKQC